MQTANVQTFLYILHLVKVPNMHNRNQIREIFMKRTADVFAWLNKTKTSWKLECCVYDWTAAFFLSLFPRPSQICLFDSVVLFERQIDASVQTSLYSRKIWEGRGRLHRYWHDCHDLIMGCTVSPLAHLKGQFSGLFSSFHTVCSLSKVATPCPIQKYIWWTYNWKDEDVLLIISLSSSGREVSNIQSLWVRHTTEARQSRRWNLAHFPTVNDNRCVIYFALYKNQAP